MSDDQSRHKEPMHDTPSDDTTGQPGGLGEMLGGAMPFLDHLEELRRRLIKSVVAIIVMALIAYGFIDYIMVAVVQPFGDRQLHNMEVTGAFYAYLKVALILGVVGALPIIFWQMWSFISPGLYKREKMALIPLVVVSTFLFLLGGAFCYFVVLPLAINFLMRFSEGMLINYITISSYISFAGLLLLAFGAAFQLPVIAFMLARFGLLTPEFLVKGRRYAVILTMVVSAIITPPDIFTMVLLAVPLYILYEVSIVVTRLGRKKAEE